MYEMEEFFLTLFGIIAVFLLIWLVILVVEYFLKGMALSRMARNAGLPSPGLAWVPFANNHLLGTLCERSGIGRTGRAWKFSVILPVLDLVRFLGGGASLAFLEEFTDYLYYDWDYPPMMWENLFSSIGSLIGLAFTVLMAVALYNLYCDYAPGKEVLFTVLSVIFSGMAQAIILFVLRDRVPVSARMGGYPPPRSLSPGPRRSLSGRPLRPPVEPAASAGRSLYHPVGPASPAKRPLYHPVGCAAPAKRPLRRSVGTGALRPARTPAVPDPLSGSPGPALFRGRP